MCVIFFLIFQVETILWRGTNNMLFTMHIFIYVCIIHIYLYNKPTRLLVVKFLKNVFHAMCLDKKARSLAWFLPWTLISELCVCVFIFLFCGLQIPGFTWAVVIVVINPPFTSLPSIPCFRGLLSCYKKTKQKTKNFLSSDTWTHHLSCHSHQCKYRY